MTKTPAEIRAVVLDLLDSIAPDSDLPRLDPKRSLRDQLDIDSMDFLNLVRGLHRRLGIQIPDADYSKIGTLDDCVTYLARSLTAA
jgi:acyl carrier protein